MGDVERLLANGGWAIVGVVVGAVLTYLFNALNRRHQEKREDHMRSYEARFNAYAEFSDAELELALLAETGRLTEENRDMVRQRLGRALGIIRLVGSDEVRQESSRVIQEGMVALAEGKHIDETEFTSAMAAFETFARMDLRHPL